MRSFIFQSFIVLALGAAGGVLGFWAYLHLALGIHLHDQRGTLRFPPQFAVRARTTRNVDIGLRGRINAQVPIKQVLEVALRDRYHAILKLHARIPVRFAIVYRGAIPVHATAMVEGTTALALHSKLLPKFPLRAPVPLDFMLPVHLVVPVDTRFELDYRGPVAITFDQPVHAPVDAVLDTYLDVKQTVSTPLTSAFAMLLHTPETAVPIVIEDARLKLPLRTLRLEKHPLER